MHSSTGRRIIGLILGVLLVSAATSALSESSLIGSRVTKGSKAAAMDACVTPTTADIRRNHMDYLKHGRDDTVHQGKRNTKYSLNECVNCHAEKDGNGGYKPINSEGQFCNSCHDYVAVSLDCFQCHRKIPEDKRPQISLNPDETLPEHHRLGLMLDSGKKGWLIEERPTALHTGTRGE